MAKYTLSTPAFVILLACSSPSAHKSHSSLEQDPRCPLGMAFVSGGPFLTGAQPEELDLPDLGYRLGFVPRAEETQEVHSFCMDRFEYPNQPGILPMRQVTWRVATQACAQTGKRLCTELEFERACGGVEGYHQPYGAEYVSGACNTDVVTAIGEDRWLVASGAYTDCQSPEGIFDLEGNLSEWVDVPDGSYSTPPPLRDVPPKHATPSDAAPVRGGTMWIAIYGSGCHARHLHSATGPTSSDDGFRCCADPHSPPTQAGAASRPGL